jgi:CDP-paratose 2-epimerase
MSPALDRGPVVVTGGSGFIGSNLADSLLADGAAEVVVLDNLSRPGVRQNLDWLLARHGARVRPFIADIRDAAAIAPAFDRAEAVFHFAAQTAVTTSLADPAEDFEINARGTFNVLEAVRRAGRHAPVIFASTNKVYGGLPDMDAAVAGDRYVPADAAIAANGIDETRPLDFCTPYGCSKGAADQYVLDYAASYGIPTAVLRMSCIYGPRQFGTEDQGWVAHFLIRALAGESISIYGDGKQVRDILHVDDAVAAYRALLAHIDVVKGRAFNLGGGPANAVSLNQLLGELAGLVGHAIEIDYADWRQGDQVWFVADTFRLQQAVGWRPAMGWREGVRDLAGWLAANRRLETPLPRRDVA